MQAFSSENIQHSTTKESGKTAVVIGSGFGGLAAAIRLQALGYSTRLLEKQAQIGGRASQLKDAGYTFDLGPSLITAPSVIDSIFEAAGKQREDYLELLPLDPYYRIYFHDGSEIDYSGDPEAMKAQMRRYSPRDADRYDDFMQAIRPIHKAVIEDGLGGRPFDTLRTMIAFLPRLIKTRAFLPVTTFVSRYFKDFRHHFMFSFHPLFIGGNPFRSPSVYLSIPYLERDGGVWFTEGGMYSLVEALGKLFTDIGGTIETGAEVEQIEVDAGSVSAVRTSKTRYPADIVISNADVGHTYAHLIAPEHRRKWSERKIDKLDFTMSCFLLYLGTKRQYPQLAHHTLILAQRYKELLRDIFDEKVLSDDFSMYLHAPTRTDPDMAPEGCESLYVLVPVPNLRAGIDWSLEGPRFEKKVLGFLEDWGLEGLQANTEVCHRFTPDDFAANYNAYVGNAFGLEPKISQTAYFRPHNSSEDIDGLYFAGASTHPGAGVPGVMLSAEAAVYCVERDMENR